MVARKALNHIHQKFQMLLNKSGFVDYSLPFKAWNSTSHVLVSILLASFVVNLVSLAFPLALLQIYDRIIPNNAMSTLVLLAVIVGVALVFEAGFRIARSYVGGWADSKFEHMMGCHAFNSLVESRLDVFEREGAGIHLKRMNALSMLREYYAGQALIAAADVPFILLILVIIYFIAQWIVLIPIAIVIGYILLTFKEASKLQKVLKDRHDHDERRYNFIIETLSHIHTVKSVTMEAQMQRRYERLQKVTAVHDYELSLKGSTSAVAGLSVSQLMVICIVAVGSTMVVNGALTIGGLAACTILSGRCLQPINTIVGLWTRLQSIKLANEELKEVLSMPRECPTSLPSMPKVQGDIKIEKMGYRYSQESEWIFKDFNLHIPAKRTIAITGHGAGGKSTLAWLLMALFPPEEGRILLDNQDMRAFNLSSVRKQIGYLPQKAVIFKGTILENLTLFEPERYFEHAKNICRILGIADVIERLPLGYDTVIGDQAIDTLSRGVNQRIAIARAFVHDPRIVIFDEANTAMDQHSDKILIKALKEIKGKRTMILISHRPSIVSIADEAYKLSKHGLEKLDGK